MKYIVLCPDGASDWPLNALGDKTPLEVARLPHIARLAKEGRVGRTQHAVDSVGNGSDVCCMSMLGADPARYHTGRAPLEAKALGLDLADNEIAVRCNAVTIEDDMMIDYSAGHISTAESRQLILDLEDQIGHEGQHLYPGVQYRHILVLKRATNLSVDCTPPHDIIGKAIAEYLPKGVDAELLQAIMTKSIPVFENHPVNRARRAEMKNPATQVWLWGYGPRPALPSFRETFGIDAAIISAVDLLRSLGLYMGIEVLDVPGITGFIDTDYAAKGRAAIEALERKDLVFVHVEAPDECGHMGDEKKKIEALERIDQDIVGPLLASEPARNGALRIMVCPDHPTPCALKTHTTEPVPLLFWGPGFEPNGWLYTENDARRSRFSIEQGHQVMAAFLKQGNADD